MLENQNHFDRWSLFGGWVLANLVGCAAGLAMGEFFTLAASKLPWLNEDRFFAYATLISLGVAIGLAQRFVIRHHLPTSARWVTATIIGYLLCLLIILLGNLIRIGTQGYGMTFFC